ncbi:MAG: FAD-dependent oxidoreductase, partial [Comamonadaceae bacterium]
MAAQPRIVRRERLDAAIHVPVAIVGAGACGLTAAIALRDAGIECLLLERDAQPSGSTALSSGFIPAAGTRAQAAQGIDDSIEVFADDIQRKARGSAASHLVDAYVRAVAPALDSLQAHGLAFEVLDGFLYPGHRVHRMHTLPQRTGAALVAALLSAATAAGADVLCSARVVELCVDASDR